MGEVVTFPPQKAAPNILTCDAEEAARQLGRLKIILVDELDFTLRKLIALCGVEEAQRYLVERAAATGLTLTSIAVTVEAPCA